MWLGWTSPTATATAEIMPENPDRPSKADQSTNPKEGKEGPGHNGPVISKAPETSAINEVGGPPTASASFAIVEACGEDPAGGPLD